MSDSIVQTLRHHRKFLIQMSGPPGSGKSTTAKLLLSLIDAVILDHDIIRSSLLENDMPFYQAAKAAYGLNWTLVEALLQQERSVIVDSPCNYQEALDRGTALAQQYGYEYWYIECKTEDFNLLDERLRNRLPLRSQRTSIFKAPADALPAVNSSKEDSRGGSEQWTKTPCRPDHNVIFVDASGDLEMRKNYLMVQMCPPSTKDARSNLVESKSEL